MRTWRCSTLRFASKEGATFTVAGTHPAGTKYTGKFGYPTVSNATIAEVNMAEHDGIIIPGGFAPDYMRRSEAMKTAIVDALKAGKPVAAICHGPWMFCSAKKDNGRPVIDGVKCTSFVAVKDDVENAGGIWEDSAVVVACSDMDGQGKIITSRTPNDLTPFCHAI